MNTVEEYWVPFDQSAEPPKVPEAPEKPPKKKKASDTAADMILDFFESAKTAVIIVMLLFLFVFRVVGVEGGSMLPTFHNGDWLAVTAMNVSPFKRGDVVVITQPWERDVPIIKRVIGVGGDTVDIDFAAGTVTVNGEILREDYTNTPTNLSYDVAFPVTVPEGMLFVMGDNRNDSLDSRSSQIGFVDERYVLGKTVFRIFSRK